MTVKRTEFMETEVGTIDVAFEFLWIVVDRKARNWKSPKTRSANEKMIKLERTITFSNFVFIKNVQFLTHLSDPKIKFQTRLDKILCQ